MNHLDLHARTLKSDLTGHPKGKETISEQHLHSPAGADLVLTVWCLASENTVLLLTPHTPLCEHESTGYTSAHADSAECGRGGQHSSQPHGQSRPFPSHRELSPLTRLPA